jgi:apolipoprotein N-acyltransferase
MHLLDAPSVRSAFVGGLLCGAVQFFVLLIWIPPVISRYGGFPAAAAWIVYLLLVAAMALYSAVCCGVTVRCMRAADERYLFLFPLIWVAAEYIRGLLIFGGFPWLLVGYSQTPHLRLIQIADLAGVYGVSFVVMWVNVCLTWGLRRRALSAWPMLSAAALLAASIGYGHFSLRRWDQDEPRYRAALLQGNLQFEDTEELLQWKFQQGYLQLVNQLRTDVDLLILPESPSPKIFQHDMQYREAMLQLARRFSLGIVLNNIAYGDVPGESRYFNSAYFISSEGRESARYDKIHLVPFGEYVPWKGLFSFAETISKDVGGFEPGVNRVVARLNGHAANAVICFEAVFPDLVRRFVSGGSQLIINLTNDAWYGDTAAPYQHLAMARWRAVENRRYLLRAANSGISAIVEPTGAVQSSTDLLQPGICEGRFGFISEQSFYSRHGDVFVYLCVMILCLLVIRASWSARKAAVSHKSV